jgi:hypothetical protein
MKSKTLLLVGAAAVWCLAVSAALAEGTKTQDERAAACAHEARALKGEERQKALEECLKQEHGNGNGGGHHSQQEKMKTCNVEAGRRELHGDERRAFMSSCLKG